MSGNGAVLTDLDIQVTAFTLGLYLSNVLPFKGQGLLLTTCNGSVIMEGNEHVTSQKFVIGDAGVGVGM